jgi:hypothetical protein
MWSSFIKHADACNSETTESQREASYKCACAILGGRFPDIRSALNDPEFLEASAPLVAETLEKIRKSSQASKAAELWEQRRRETYFKALVNLTEDEASTLRQDISWLQSMFDTLLTKSDRRFISRITVDDMRVFSWCFELAPKDDRRYWSYTFQYNVYKDLVAMSDGGLVAGGDRLYEMAKTIFGDAVYTTRHIKDSVAKGHTERPDQGRPCSFPRDVESVLFRYVSMLRINNHQVYKSTVLHYGMKLLEGTAASLAFALKQNGKYVPHPAGGVEWDMQKLDMWFYRRFMGDRKANGARMGNQVLLDIHRARWHSFEAMKPYFMTHVQALVDEKICIYNPR